MTLTRRVLSDLIGSIYDCALAPSRWGEVLGDVARAFSCDRAILSLNDLRQDRVLIGESVGWEPRWLAERERHAPEIHGTIAKWFSHQPAEDEPFVASREFVPSEVAASAYARDCLMPLGIGDVAHYFLIRSAAHFSEVVLARQDQDGVFGAEEIELGKLLLPHLRRSVTISKVLDAQMVERHRMADALDVLRCGVFMTDPQGTILHANRSGLRMLRHRGFLHSRHGVLRVSRRDANDELQRALRFSAANEVDMGRTGVAIRLSAPEEPPVLAHVLPLSGSEARPRLEARASAAVFVGAIDDDELNIEAIAAAFGLTKAECRVITSLLSGRTLTETSLELGVARATAKTHLESIFRKTGVNRQTDLIRLVMHSWPAT